MEVPRLKVEVEKGGKVGEIHEFEPGSKIQIGRVGKINTLRIKDSGISSEHLLIELNNKNSKWVVSDLGSFNGTFLNDVQLDPNKRHVLKNGDIIKIGEETTLKVTIGGGVTSTWVVDSVKAVGCNSEVVQLRRNPRRAATRAEESCLAENVCAVVRRSRGRPRKGNVDLESEAVNRVSAGVTDAKVQAPASEPPKVEERMSLEKDICAMPSTSEKSIQTEKLTRSKLENMTLGEWFDYVEVYLARQTREDTEEIIRSMKARAEQYKEFMSQQNKSPT